MNVSKPNLSECKVSLLKNCRLHSAELLVSVGCESVVYLGHQYARYPCLFTLEEESNTRGGV